MLYEKTVIRLEPYSPDAVQKRKDTSNGVLNQVYGDQIPLLQNLVPAMPG